MVAERASGHDLPSRGPDGVEKRRWIRDTCEHEDGCTGGRRCAARFIEHHEAVLS